MSEPFERLHPSVRYLVREVLRFPALRPVQAETIDPVLEGRDIVVLAPTAGGKTEAAILPILSRILTEKLPAISALYICPLRALLNNQEGRITRMAEAVGLRVGKWHGDVPSTLRKGIIAEPPDVLLITPESLEVLLLSPGDYARTLLPAVRIAVVDEVHAFAADARGAHLLSVLERLQIRSGRHIQRIGLSATVGNPAALATWLQGSGGDGDPRVVAPAGERKTPRFRFEVAQGTRKAAALVRDLGGGQKRLVFVQSRSRAEELARVLQEVGVRTWVHHSSVGRSSREEAEAAFENASDATLVATSSLELGIDIGDLDHIFQMDAPVTVASLAQRLGRTGRRPGSVPTLTFVAEAPEDLLLGMALASLHGEGWVEDLRPSRRLWTVLVHQLFANLLETGGTTRERLWGRLNGVPSFAGVEKAEFDVLLASMLADGWVEEVDGAVLLGRQGEKVFGARNFFRLYAVFESPDVLSVRVGNTEIGTLQKWFAAQLVGKNRCFRLAGRSWEVREIDFNRGVVQAQPAGRGVIPMWTGRPEGFSRTVCERILHILRSEDLPTNASGDGLAWLAHARAQVAHLDLIEHGRPVVFEEDRIVWHTFAGAKINLVLARLIAHQTGLTTSVSNLSVKVKSTRQEVADAICETQHELATGTEPGPNDWATFDTESRAAMLSAFQACLPDAFEQEFLRAAWLDVEGARRWAGEVETMTGGRN